MKNIFILICLWLATGVSAQGFELRPSAQYSFFNIARVQALGLRLEALARVKKGHYFHTSFEWLHGEGNRGFSEYQSGKLYSYAFDDPASGNKSGWAYLFKEPLRVKSARLNLAALKLGYLYRKEMGKDALEFGAQIYGNYVSGGYVIGTIEDEPNYVSGGNPIDIFVLHYFFNYLDIGPTANVRYMFKRFKKVAPVLGLEFNYGTQRGSWAALSLGMHLL